MFFFTISYLIPEYSKPKFKPVSEVGSFRFTTQDGKDFTDADIKGKVTAVEYFFTTCEGICPRMNKNMLTAYNELKQEPDFLILSHTSDPERDSAARLKQFADSMGVDTKKWIFLTGRKDSLYNMARYSYAIDDPKNHFQKIEDDFLHSQFMALVNKNGEVVHVYDGLKQSEVNEMIREAKKLLKD